MTADTVGGVWTYSIELIRGLAEYGVEVALATMGALPTPEQRAEIEEIDNVDLYPSEFKLEWMDDPWEDVERAGKWLLRLENRLRPDIVHLNGYAHGALPWQAPVMIVGHSCVLSWWQAVKGEQAPSEWDHYRQEVAQGLHSVQLVVSPTRAMLNVLKQHYGPFTRTGVVPNCRRAELFSRGRKNPFIFTAGRVWDEAKNIAALAEIAPKLKWPVHVAGDEEHPNGGGSNHRGIRLLGRLAPQVMPYWFGHAAIYALPARYEPFGLSALEAGLAGCVLVLGDIPSLREVWGDAAVFVPPDDHDKLMAAINEIISDEQLRLELSSRARKRALYFTPERMAEGYVTLYRELTKSRAPAADIYKNPAGIE